MEMAQLKGSLGKNVIDLNGHCFLCLRKFANFQASSEQVIQVESPSMISPFQDLLPYLSSRKTDHLECPVLPAKVPPVCTTCYCQLLSLDVLHQQFISIRRRLHAHARELQEIVRNAGDMGVDGSCTGRLEEFRVSSLELEVTRMRDTMQFLCLLRGRKFDGMEATAEDKGEEQGENELHEEFTDDNDDGGYDNDYLESQEEDDVKPDLEELQIAARQEEDEDESLSEVRKSTSVPSSRYNTRKSTAGSTKRKKLDDSSSDDYDDDGSPSDQSEDDDYSPSDKEEEEQTCSTRNSKIKDNPFLFRSITGRIQTQLCEVCNRRIQRSVMKRHLQSHVTPEYIYPCPSKECGLCYLTPLRRDRFHLKISPNCLKACNITVEQVKTFKCTVCDFQTVHPGTWKFHIKKHEDKLPEKVLPCPIASCNLWFALKQSVEQHLNVHVYKTDPNRKKKQKCPVCPKYVDLSALENHLKKQHKLETIFKCRQCPFIYDSLEKLMFHKRRHRSRGEGMICDLCPASTDEPVYDKVLPLLEHYSSVHNLSKEIIICDVCERVFVTQCQLRAHKTECQKLYPEGYNLEHQQNTTKTATKTKKLKTFKCDICVDPPVEFNYEDRLSTHKVKVHGADPFVCQVCQRTFNSKAACVRHFNDHSKPVSSNIAKLQCEICGNRYKYPRQLSDHVEIVHLKTKERFKCDQCPKSFCKRDVLQHHKKIAHLGVKKHVCAECGLGLTSSHGLKAHERIHTGERPFSCDQCGKTFTQEASLYTHRKLHNIFTTGSQQSSTKIL